MAIKYKLRDILEDYDEEYLYDGVFTVEPILEKFYCSYYYIKWIVFYTIIKPRLIAKEKRRQYAMFLAMKMTSISTTNTIYEDDDFFND